MKKTVSIIGGGNSAHALIPLLSKANYEVNLLSGKPGSWKKKIKLEYQSESNEVKETFTGELNNVSNDPATILPNADLIILCLPVSQYKNTLYKIAPYINKNRKVYLGTIYGQGGFNWMVDSIKAKYSLNKLVTFAIGLIPFVARIKEYGETGITYGPKARNVAAVHPHEEFDFLNDTIFNDMCFKWFNTGAFSQADNFISLTLSVDNQIIHPSRIYGLYLKNKEGWDTKENVPFFYKDYDDLSAGLLQKVDDDYSKIRHRIINDNPKDDFKYMLDYLSLERFSYASANEDIKSSFTNSKTLRLIETPVIKNKKNKWELNKNNRFFTDDIFYGLCIAKWYAEQYKIEVPMIDQILGFVQVLFSISLISKGKLQLDCVLNDIEVGTPEKYNLSLKSSLS